MTPQNENAIFVTKPACTIAREAYQDEMNRKRMAQWKARKRKFKDKEWMPFKITTNLKLDFMQAIKAYKFMAENKIELRIWK